MSVCSKNWLKFTSEMLSDDNKQVLKGKRDNECVIKPQDANVSRPVSLCPVLGKIKILGAFNANLNIINLILII